MSFDYRKLAKEVLSEYPCAVHICISPYYWQNKGFICTLGDFEPTEMDKLAKRLEKVSKQIYKETGYSITSIDWVDIFPEDESLLNARIKKANEDFATLLDSLQSDLIEESER